MPFLDWVNKNQAQQAAREVPYHLLKQEAVYGDPAENLLIQGDNLLALKALIPFYAGRVKCIFIDPPYNTQSAFFEHYDDKLEHSQWLSMMYPRLVLLRDLLSAKGFIVVHIDDAESHYIKALLDEIFGRSNYEMSVYVQVRYQSKTLKSDMAYHKQIEQALIYRRSPDAKPYRPIIQQEGFSKFNFDIVEKSKGQLIELGGKQVTIFQPSDYEIKKVEGHIDGLKEIWATGTILDGNSSGRFFRDYLAGRIEQDGVSVLYKVTNIGDDGLGYRYFTGPKKLTATKGKYFQGVPVDKRHTEIQEVVQPIDNFYDFSSQFGNCRHEGGVEFRSGKKPENYVKKMLDLFSQPGDLVLDSFLGSGTTAAVAHKTARPYIGIEFGEQATTHCVPRLLSVIEGDRTGVALDVDWQGGGGFRLCTLGEAAFDEHGRINAAVKFSTLAAFVWHFETGIPSLQPSSPRASSGNTPLLGIYNGTAYYLLYNGILGDRKPSSGNVLTHAVLQAINEICPHAGHKIIYGETTRLGAARLAAENITFKQIPYDVKMRG
ncbi:MAG: site-specific DNA-methyltransferase [Gallionella sp.]|nr:site-specific DNA-methyltransferase [Gallionella sp.]